jgi:hypothetical protein
MRQHSTLVRWVTSGVGRTLFWLVLVATVTVWTLAGTGKVTFNSQGLWAAAALALVSAVLCIADMVATPKVVERLREHGLSADATIVKVKEHFVQIDYGYTGWVTNVEVSFVDAHGGMVRAKYYELDRSREQAGQMVQIFYDPEKPTSISPVGRSSCPEDQSVAIAGLGAVMFFGMSVYFAYLALRAVG